MAQTYLFTIPLRQRGFRQCLPFSWTTLRDKHCRHPIAIIGVVDTFGQGHFKVAILFIFQTFYFPKKNLFGGNNNFLEVSMDKRNINATLLKATAPLCLGLVTVWYLHSNYSHYFFLIADLSGVYWDVNSNKRESFCLDHTNS